jgi:tol-pal system protein YbgF
MFRRTLLPCACLAVALGAAALVAVSPALAQDRSTQERLDRLERDLSMMQRQVYRGGPPPMGGDPGGAVGAQVRMDRIEEQMRDPTGRVEEFNNQVEQLRRRVEQINGDMDTRMSQGPGPGPYASAGPPPGRPERGSIGPGPRSRPPGPPEPLDPDSAGLAPPATLVPPGTPMPPPGGPFASGARSGGAPPGPVFGTLTPPGSPPTSPEQAAANAGRSGPAATPAAAPSGGSPTQQYNRAFALVKQADYPAAETALRAFVDQYPKDPLAGSAQYWLGETYFTRGKYMEAAAAFAEGYKRYPKSPKAAEGLLKLGMALGHANQKQNACVALGQLDHDFPNPGGAVKERANSEKKRLGC